MSALGALRARPPGRCASSTAEAPPDAPATASSATLVMAWEMAALFRARTTWQDPRSVPA